MLRGSNAAGSIKSNSNLWTFAIRHKPQGTTHHILHVHQFFSVVAGLPHESHTHTGWTAIRVGVVAPTCLRQLLQQCASPRVRGRILYVMVIHDMYVTKITGGEDLKWWSSFFVMQVACCSCAASICCCTVCFSVCPNEAKILFLNFIWILYVRHTWRKSNLLFPFYWSGLGHFDSWPLILKTEIVLNRGQPTETDGNIKRVLSYRIKYEQPDM